MVGVLFDGGGEGFDGEVDGDAVLGGVGGLGEIGEVGAGELEPGFGVFGVLADVGIELDAGLGGLAGAEKAGGLCERVGGLCKCGQGSDKQERQAARHKWVLADMVAYAPRFSIESRKRFHGLVT